MKPYYRLMWWGFWTMTVSSFILLMMGELLLTLAAVFMSVVCFKEFDSDKSN